MGVIETLTFRLTATAEADVAAFLAADRRVQTEFAYRQPGLLRRTTARGADGEWIVVDVWQSAADADACEARWPDDPAATAFMSFVDADSIRSARYETLD